MKRVTDHLPLQKQTEINTIAEIIRNVVNPEMIILFGSYAKGTYVEHRYKDKEGTHFEYISDYDFLVVTKDNPEKADVQENVIINRTEMIDPSVNLEIHDINYINKGLEIGEYFFADIVKEGVLLYDKGSVQFAEARELTALEKKEKAQRYFDTWFSQMRGFINASKFAAADSNIKIAAFLLHQASECGYYAVLLVFTDYKPKTHNLWKLRKKAKPYSQELFSTFRAETDHYEKHLFDLLKRGYIDARYRNDYDITADEFDILNKRVETLRSVIEKICKEKIDSFF